LAIAPEPYLTAYASVLSVAILAARNWTGDDNRTRQVFDLLDAVHNVPYYLTRWEDCDEASLRDALVHYDRNWVQSNSDLSLCGIFGSIMQQ
jgi:hypothetical protein